MSSAPTPPGPAAALTTVATVASVAPLSGVCGVSGAAGLAGLLRSPQILALVAASGATESHVVGGTLRDTILGLAVHDLDVVVAGRGGEIARDLAARLPGRLIKLGGKEFAAYRLVCADGMAVDLWDRGTTSLREDLERRDFTINSLAVDARSGALADPFGGLADLRHRVLRATTGESFTGDPLRVLRLARLGLRLPGFAATPATLELARRAVPGLAGVAAERIREELRLVLSHDQAGQGLRALAGLGVYPALWLLPPGSASAAGPHPAQLAGDRAVDLALQEMAALADRAHDLQDWLTAGRARESSADGGPAAADPWASLDLVSARFAATCRYLEPIGETTGEPAGRPLDRLRAAGYLSTRQAAAIEPLFAGSAAAAVLPESPVERRRFLHRHGRGWLTAACSYGAAASVRGAAALEDWRRRAAPLCGLASRAGAALMAPPRLLTGEEVQDLLGIPPGPRIGEALAALTAAQVDGELSTREEAAAFLRAWAPGVSARRWPARPSAAD